MLDRGEEPRAKGHDLVRGCQGTGCREREWVLAGDRTLLEGENMLMPGWGCTERPIQARLNKRIGRSAVGNQNTIN